MALKLIVLSLVCLCAYGFPGQTSVAERNFTISRNTIFADEKFQGEIFENVDAFDNINTMNRNIAAADYRLPTTTKPTHYTVFWALDFTNPSVAIGHTGSVSIQLHATQANVNQIVIHTLDLTLSNLELRLGNTLIPVTYTEDTALQFLRINLSTGTLNFNAASPIIYTLSINFAANVRTDMNGLYKNWFREFATDTTVKYMASTQFQATYARAAFPCYDEPSFKATFDVTIRRPVAYQSWFCTRLRETTTPAAAPTMRDDIYHTTPIMSTYLLALIVADYGTLERVENGLLKYEVIARRGAIQTGQGQYAMDAGQDLLEEMSNHTAYDFFDQSPNLKMTQASIPDFGAGAMENWGLLTYREAYLMYDENETNGHFKQIIAYILSHEIVHMWFGNLVTCDWWDALWLNEGFARYYQYYLTYWVEGMGFGTRFITEQVHTALLSDSANNPQPLTNPGIGSPEAVWAMFSTISYNKGAAIIRMTEHLLGFDVNRQGLRDYLRGREFQTALPIHLFEYQERAGLAAGALNYGNFSFIDYYKSWTDQPGHPVLNVHVDHRTGEMTIYQRRFNINTGYSNANNNNYIVPITFSTASNPDFENTKPTHILSKAVTVINRGSIGDEWVIFNKQQTGFYRVNYDDHTWDLIILALRGNDRTRIHEYNKAQIVNDVFQFARSGLMTYNRAFNILSFLADETEYAPWVAAMTGFTWIRNRLAATPTSNLLTQLNARIATWATNVMNSVTYLPTPNESFMRSYLRYQIAPVMCNLGVTACRESARTQFLALRSAAATPVPADSRNWVYCNGLRTGDASDFQFLWSRFQTHNVYTEKIVLLQTLGCTPDAASLRTFMTNIVTNNYIIRPQDYTTAFNAAVTGNEGNTEVAFEFIRDNMNAVAAAFGGSVATPLSYVIARFRTLDRIAQFETWANTNQAALGGAYNSAISNAAAARESIAWAQSVQADINSYLVTGDTPITITTPAPTTVAVPTTVAQPNIQEPVTPSIPAAPDSAVTAFVSIAVVVLACIANIIM